MCVCIYTCILDAHSGRNVTIRVGTRLKLSKVPEDETQRTPGSFCSEVVMPT